MVFEIFRFVAALVMTCLVFGAGYGFIQFLKSFKRKDLKS